MKHLNLLLLIFSMSTVFCSCTITKRHFGNGYHIEWNRKMKESDSQKERIKLQMAENDLVPENKGDSDSLVLSEEIVKVKSEVHPENTKTRIETKNPPTGHSVRRNLEPKQIKSPGKTKEEEAKKDETVKPRMHPLTWAIWGAWSIGIVFIFFVTFYAEALIGVVVFFFLAMIFAFFMIHSLRKHPEKYRLKKLSYGFVIPAIIFGGIVLAGLGLFLIMMLA
nr:hypothetical protein [uncultured Fluviicola sp.]